MPCECGVEPSPRDKGFVFQGVYDGVLLYQCGTCMDYWPRFNVPSRLHDTAVQIIANWKKDGQAE